MSDEHGRRTLQATLDGEEIEIEWPECEMHDICTNSAEYIVETLAYDGSGYALEIFPMCPTCAREITEPEEPEHSDAARPISARDRMKEARDNDE